ncbi:helix-turn-helix domain-containing protein [Amycolatopsis sp. H20-H5]|uniref:helix-turn-helix domain-containing protein n=1 Tax=Amycolatopsis sp. H20-H5 TaxID=3046309 RepID=UPI002DB70DAA|nr:helix-turn-helix domain-containing protein [Amycolatopsis sp. H20-H5]MEC3977887.1 helix-turn-helix domain-containing protein [Amycolatopsis sp. H20-H5]
MTNEDRERVRALHAAGRNRNQIAKDIGRSGATVSKIARELGLSFDRSATAAATEAKVIDAKARRAALAVALLGDAERLREQLFAPAEIHSFGGKENTHNSVQVPQPQFADQRNIIQATSTAITTSLRLDQHDGDSSNEQVGSLLGALFESISTKHAEPATDGG